jgi:hypothetical protein
LPNPEGDAGGILDGAVVASVWALVMPVPMNAGICGNPASIQFSQDALVGK